MGLGSDVDGVRCWQASQNSHATAVWPMAHFCQLGHVARPMWKAVSEEAWKCAPHPSRFCRSATWGGPCLGLEFPVELIRLYSHKSFVHISHFDTPFFLLGLLREGFSRLTAKMVNITEKIKE